MLARHQPRDRTHGGRQILSLTRTHTPLDAARYDTMWWTLSTPAQVGADRCLPLERGLPSSVSMGAGPRPTTKLEIADISKTHHRPLAHMLRKRLHKIAYAGVLGRRTRSRYALGGGDGSSRGGSPRSRTSGSLPRHPGALFGMDALWSSATDRRVGGPKSTMTEIRAANEKPIKNSDGNRTSYF